MKLAVFIEHDIMIRHFVLSRALEPLEQEHEVHWVFPKHKRITIGLDELGLKNLHLIKLEDTKERRQKYKTLYQIEWLRRLRTFPPEYREQFLRMWKQGALTEEELALRQKQARGWRYRLTKARLMASLGEERKLLAFLGQLKPDAIVHPTTLRGLFVDDLIRYGKRLRIPTVYIMNSWDNPSTKASGVGSPDRLAVWGEQTRQHAIQFMGMAESRLRMVGAAQFEVYKKPPQMSRTQYLARLGLAPEDRVIAYAGCSKEVDETAHLQALEAAVERGDLTGAKILYRPHPWRAFPEGETYFYDLKWKHVIMDPTMEECFRAAHAGNKRPISLADYRDTHVVLSAIDALISPLSTILLEAALHGKPIMCLIPTAELEDNAWVSTNTRFPHFTEFFEKVDCVMCERTEDLPELTRKLLALREDPELPKRLAEQTQFFVEPSDLSYAKRLEWVIRELMP